MFVFLQFILLYISRNRKLIGTSFVLAIEPTTSAYRTERSTKLSHASNSSVLIII